MRRLVLFQVIVVAWISIYAQTPSIPGVLDPAFIGSKAELSASSGVSVSKSNIVAWYDFADTNDAAASYDLTEIGSPPYTGGPPSYGSSIRSPTNMWTQVQISTNWGWATNASVTFAIRFRGVSGVGSGNRPFYSHNGTRTIRWLTSGITANIGLNGSSMPLGLVPVTNVWYTIVLRYDYANSLISAHTNGLLSFSTNLSSMYVPGGSVFLGGESASVPGQFDIDFAGFWSRAISTNEIVALSTNTITYGDLE